VPWGNPKAVAPVGDDDDQPSTEERIFWQISKQHPDNMATKTHKTFHESRVVLFRGQITAGSWTLPLPVAPYTFKAYECGAASREKKPVLWIC